MYKCLEKGYKFPEITSWIRASKEDFKLVKEIGNEGKPGILDQLFRLSHFHEI